MSRGWVVPGLNQWLWDDLKDTDFSYLSPSPSSGVGISSGMSPNTGVPNLQAVDQYFLSDQQQHKVRNKGHIKVMSLNHSETVHPTPTHGKIVFHEIGPLC